MSYLNYELLPQGQQSPAVPTRTDFRNWRMLFKKTRSRRASVHFLHVRARPHVAEEACEKLVELDWHTILSPSCFLDTGLSDYHLSRLLKAFLAKTTITKIKIVERVVSEFFDSQSHQFWEKGIAHLPIKWHTVVTKGRDYIVENSVVC